MVPIQTGGSETPFFFLHGQYDLGGFYCYRLAHALGPDRPFYALEPTGSKARSLRLHFMQ